MVALAGFAGLPLGHRFAAAMAYGCVCGRRSATGTVFLRVPVLVCVNCDCERLLCVCALACGFITQRLYFCNFLNIL